MFSTNQDNIIKTLVPAMRRQGYRYYIAYTNTSTESSWNSSSEVDLYIIFSSEEILANSQYSYSVPDGAVRYSIRSGNYSTSNNAVNTERLVSSSFSGTVNIDVYEHVYTNAEFSGYSVQPDILYTAQGGYLYEGVIAASLLCATLLLFIVFRALIRVSAKR